MQSVEQSVLQSVMQSSKFSFFLVSDSKPMGDSLRLLHLFFGKMLSKSLTSVDPSDVTVPDDDDDDDGELNID